MTDRTSIGLIMLCNAHMFAVAHHHSAQLNHLCIFHVLYRYISERAFKSPYSQAIPGHTPTLLMLMYFTLVPRQY